MAKILIVDDAPFVRKMLRDIIVKNGYMDIIEAADGVEAVERFRNEKPDLTILDITMPRKDGLQALKEIKDIEQSAVCIMCSAMGQEAMVLDAIYNGASDFIVKPFKADRIMMTLNRLLGG